MATIKNVVSIHPYFKPHEGKLDDFLAMLPTFVERTSTEPACLYYDFTVNDGIIHCREAYIGAEGAQAHLQNVGDLLEQALGIAELLRLELHGPADELEKMKEGLAALNPDWFAYQTGLERVGTAT